MRASPPLPLAKRLRAEYVIGVRGTVRPRAADMANPRMPPAPSRSTPPSIRVLSEAKVPPFQIADDVAVSRTTCG